MMDVWRSLSRRTYTSLSRRTYISLSRRTYTSLSRRTYTSLSRRTEALSRDELTPLSRDVPLSGTLHPVPIHIPVTHMPVRLPANSSKPRPRRQKSSNKRRLSQVSDASSVVADTESNNTGLLEPQSSGQLDPSKATIGASGCTASQSPTRDSFEPRALGLDGNRLAAKEAKDRALRSEARFPL
jgi:hypothetical protein